MRALTALVEALAEAGHYGRAEHVAAIIADTDYQAQALTSLAEALAEAGQTALARPVTAKACQVGEWSTFVGFLGSIEPESICALADDLTLLDRDKPATP